MLVSVRPQIKLELELESQVILEYKRAHLVSPGESRATQGWVSAYLPEEIHGKTYDPVLASYSSVCIHLKQIR